MLRDSFSWAGYHLIGVQEGSASVSSTWNSPKMLRIALGTAKGCRTVELWVSRNSYGKLGDKKLVFQCSDFVLLADLPGFVLV